jgi:hypothetical protein
MALNHRGSSSGAQNRAKQIIKQETESWRSPRQPGEDSAADPTEKFPSYDGTKGLAQRQAVSAAAGKLGIAPDTYEAWMDYITNPQAALGSDSTDVGAASNQAGKAA